MPAFHRGSLPALWLVVRCLLAVLPCRSVLGAERIIQDCAACPRMVPLPAGAAMVGDLARAPELAPHRVMIAYRFALGETEITRAQFRYFLSRTGYQGGHSDEQGSEDDLPVTGVDWFAAKAYALWLSRHTGQHYRLPSEAEWEYAARAGTTTRYWWGEAAGGACANEHLDPLFYDFDQPCEPPPSGALQRVASKRPNPWGLYDMLGNAEEWMMDCPPGDLSAFASAPVNGAADLRCVFFNSSRVVRAAGEFGGAMGRRKQDPVSTIMQLGFRVLRELQ